MYRVFLFLILTLFSITCLPTGGGFAPPTAQAETKKKSGAKVIKIKQKKPSTGRKKQVRQTTRKVQPVYAPPSAELVVNATTGMILHEESAEAPRHPASLTKMMTLYLLFDALEKGKVSMSTRFPVSEKAARQPPTNIFLEPGDEIPVRTAIDALVIRSANDVAMVVAEALGGSQEGFAQMMNKTARELGMKKTRFYNPSGLPDDRQLTTALDMAKLGIALRRDFPQHFHSFSQDDFEWNDREYTSHNRLLGRYPGADGIKTGYTRSSGFNLVTSVERGRTRLIGVVLGGRTGAARDQRMIDMLDETFLNLARPNSGRSIKVSTPPTKTPEIMPPSPPVAAPAAETPTAPSLQETWGIQVGAYREESQAKAAVADAKIMAASVLSGASVVITMTEREGIPYYRARLIGVSDASAKEACKLLANENRQCMLIRLEQ